MVYTTLIRAIPLLVSSLLLPIADSHAKAVSFQTVVNASQQAAAPDHRLAYGDLPDQYGLLWLPDQPANAVLV